MTKWVKLFEKKILHNRKAMRIILVCEVLILLVAANMISQSVSLNDDDERITVDSSRTSDIKCVDGGLIVNDVKAEVPSGTDVTYNIAYSWGEDDTDYPTVPYAATASFAGEGGGTAYDISLYMDSSYSKADIPKGKTVDNWFDDWNSSDDASGGSLQQPAKAGKLNGFLISSDVSGDGSYSARTFYFAKKFNDGIAVYILEGILYDEGSAEAFESVYKECMESLGK